MRWRRGGGRVEKTRHRVWGVCDGVASARHGSFIQFHRNIPDPVRFFLIDRPRGRSHEFVDP